MGELTRCLKKRLQNNWRSWHRLRKVNTDEEIIRFASLLDNIPPLKRKTRKKRNAKPEIYRDCICAFDIETTNYKKEEESFMYIWQFCIWSHGHWAVIFGSTWEQFTLMMDELNNRLKKDERVLCFVHNLSFEFQFLTGIYDFDEESVFCLDKRRIGKCQLGGVEIRCSYVLTNLSLQMFTKQMGVKHGKFSGDRYDYGKIRTPSMSLPTYQMLYCRNDVLGLCEAIAEKMKREGDDHYTQVLTATGYIRREAVKAMEGVNYRYRSFIQPITIDPETDEVNMDLFNALRRAFRGGNTHASRFYAEEIMSNVESYDRSSSYPEVLCNHDYPKNKMWRIGKIGIGELYKKLTLHNMAMLLVLQFKHLRLRSPYISCPYLPVAKMLLPEIYYEDNGRLLETPEETWSEVVVTDVDFRIIIQQYDWDEIVIADSWGCVYGKLPQPLIDLTIKHYKAKTEYKGVEGMDAIYLASKERLNSIYGMMCQNPCRPSIKYRRDGIEDVYEEDHSTPDAELLRRYSRKGFLPYQWAVWTTAWARWELQRGIDIVEKTDPDGWGVCLYVDTDSCKFLRTDIKPDFESYNKEKIKLAEKSGAWADDPKGNRHYMGVYEYEGCSDRFVTCGAKKYCQEEHGKLKLTVSGVPKKQGVYELMKKGGIEAFKKGFLFEHAGLAVKYNDHTDRWITVNGERIHLINNVYLYEDTYVLGETKEYEVAIRIAKQLLTEDGIDAILKEQ